MSRRNVVRVVSLFSGIGNADAGLYAAAAALGVEVRVVAAYDSWPDAVRVYNANMPEPVAQVVDVKELTLADLPPHDLVIGGPPCQPWSLAGKRGGASDERDCLPDFIRLSAGSAWLMENVIPRLIPSVPFSLKLNAFDFGDVTTRKRWFYSNYLLHVIETPGPRRFGDIRDREADRIALTKRSETPHDRKKGDTRGGRSDDGEKVATYADADALSSLTAHAWHGRDVRSNVKMVGVSDDDVLGSLTQSSFHGHKNNGSGNATAFSMIKLAGQTVPTEDDAPLGMLDDVPFGSFTGESSHRSGALLPAVITHRPRVNQQPGKEPYATFVENDGAFGSLTSDAPHNTKLAGQTVPTEDDAPLGTLTAGKGGSSGFLKVGLRGHSASAFNDDEPLGSLIANSWHGNEISRLGPSVRCPSLLEMARAHSIPDDFDWCGVTKTARGKMIANSWPRGLAEATCKAMLVAMGAACHEATGKHSLVPVQRTLLLATP